MMFSRRPFDSMVVAGAAVVAGADVELGEEVVAPPLSSDEQEAATSAAAISRVGRV